MRVVASAAFALAAAALLGACGSAREIEQSSIAVACARCHGFPPEQVSTGAPHPSSENCAPCHAESVDSENAVIAGGAHMNGRVDLTLHAVPFVDHGSAAAADGASCEACHGPGVVGIVAPSCSECH